MGGCGSASGMSDKGKPYGTEYETLYQAGNIKYVRYRDGSTTSPMETMTKTEPEGGTVVVSSVGCMTV